MVEITPGSLPAALVSFAIGTVALAAIVDAEDDVAREVGCRHRVPDETHEARFGQRVEARGGRGRKNIMGEDLDVR